SKHIPRRPGDTASRGWTKNESGRWQLGQSCVRLVAFLSAAWIRWITGQASMSIRQRRLCLECLVVDGGRDGGQQHAGSPHAKRLPSFSAFRKASVLCLPAAFFLLLRAA
ncbi:hypothetical protein COCVIDRAFT_94887, partial [Bipolaris victoriae FI3]